MATPAYLREQVMNIVNESFDFFEGRDPTLDLYLDVAVNNEGVVILYW